MPANSSRSTAGSCTELTGGDIAVNIETGLAARWFVQHFRLLDPVQRNGAYIVEVATHAHQVNHTTALNHRQRMYRRIVPRAARGTILRIFHCRSSDC